MKKLMFLFTIAGALVLTGCGGDSTTYTDGAVDSGTPADGSLVVTATGGSSAGISYTNVGDGSILVSCDGEGCGDVVIGSDVSGSIDGDGASASTCSGSSTGTCP